MIAEIFTAVSAYYLFRRRAERSTPENKALDRAHDEHMRRMIDETYRVSIPPAPLSVAVKKETLEEITDRAFGRYRDDEGRLRNLDGTYCLSDSKNLSAWNNEVRRFNCCQQDMREHGVWYDYR